VKAILIVGGCLLLTGCGDSKTQARLDAVEAQNKALAAQVQDLSKASAENVALLTKANSRSEMLDKLLKELTARTDSIAATRGIADNQISQIAQAAGSHADELFQALKKYTDQLIGFEEQARARDKVSAFQLRTDESHSVCDFFNPDLLTLRTWNGFVFYIFPVEVIPRDGGATLKFRIGNPYAAKFRDIAITVTHGIAKPKKTSDDVMTRQMHDRVFMKDPAAAESARREYDEAERNDAAEESKWRQSLKTFNINRDMLPGGSWTEVEFLIPEASLSELRYVEISVSPSAVVLAKAQP